MPAKNTKRLSLDLSPADLAILDSVVRMTGATYAGILRVLIRRFAMSGPFAPFDLMAQMGLIKVNK